MSPTDCPPLSPACVACLMRAVCDPVGMQTLEDRRSSSSPTRCKRSVISRGKVRPCRRRSTPIARRCRSGPASGCRSTGRRRRTTSAPRFRGSASGRAAPSGLQEAVDAYRAALQERTRERVPLDWATTQNNLGNALFSLAVRTHDRAKLEEARRAVNAAFEVSMQAGQEHHRRYYEDRLREIDGQLAAQ